MSNTANMILACGLNRANFEADSVDPLKERQARDRAAKNAMYDRIDAERRAAQQAAAAVEQPTELETLLVASIAQAKAKRSTFAAAAVASVQTGLKVRRTK